MKKIIISFLLTAFVLSFAVTPLMARPCVYIGEEDPKDYAIGRQANPNAEKTFKDMFLPALPDEYKEELIWEKNTIHNYTFKTANTKDESFFAAKMEDANASILDTIANFYFLPTVGATILASSFVIFVFDNHIGDNIMAFISDIIKKIFLMQEGTFAFLFFLIMMVVLAFGVAKLLMQAQLMRAFTSVLVAVLCIALMIGYIANADKIISTTFKFINNTTGIALMASRYIGDMPTNSDETTNTDSTIGITEDTPWLEQGIIEVANTMFHTFVGAPWAHAMFGSSDPKELKLEQGEIDRINNDANKTWDIQVFGANGDKAKLVDINFNAPWNKKKLSGDVYMDSLWLACSNDVKYYMIDSITTNADRYTGEGGVNTAVINTLGQGTSSAKVHTLVAFFSLIPALAFVIFVLLVGVPVFIAQFVLMALLLLLPFGLLMGIAGEKGLQITMIYLKATLGAAAVKIIYGFYMSFILVFSVALSRMETATSSIFLTGFLLTMIFIFAIKYRGRFYEVVMAALTGTPESDKFGEKGEGVLKNAISFGKHAFMLGLYQRWDSTNERKLHEDMLAHEAQNNPNVPNTRRDSNSSATGGNDINSAPPSGGSPSGDYPPSGEIEGIEGGGGFWADQDINTNPQYITSTTNQGDYMSNQTQYNSNNNEVISQDNSSDNAGIEGNTTQGFWSNNAEQTEQIGQTQYNSQHSKEDFENSPNNLNNPKTPKNVPITNSNTFSSPQTLQSNEEPKNPEPVNNEPVHNSNGWGASRNKQSQTLEDPIRQPEIKKDIQQQETQRDRSYPRPPKN